MTEKDLAKQYQITEYCHSILAGYIRPGDICVDATAGNGSDTEFLCRLTGEGGKVYAFDIQEDAIDHTRKRLGQAGLLDSAELICDSHEKMKEYVREQVSAVVFNLGYLPGGDHKIATLPDISLRAAREGLSLLKPGGVLGICIYSGGDTGYEEKAAFLRWLKDLDTREWLVILHSFYNRGNDPPLPAFVIRLR